jgi:hypothetical protein
MKDMKNTKGRSAPGQSPHCLAGRSGAPRAPLVSFVRFVVKDHIAQPPRSASAAR